MAAASAFGGLDARITAALPTGVRLEDLRGPWMLDVGDVKFETDERGRTCVLGRGASGVVFAGTYCTEPAAIKQVFPVTGSDVNAWLTEVQLQYRIRADVVLAVHGALLDIDNASRLLYYIVMQRVPGCMMSLMLTPGGALAGADTRRRIQWLRQAAAALASLHSRRIIHGDVKPANLMLSSVDEAEATVRVADFGSALVRSPGAGTMTTHRGERGSMVYMDPVLFDGGSVTVASDTYSWAITAWQVLSGRVPYAAELAAAGVTSDALALDALRRHVRGATARRPPVAVFGVMARLWAATASPSHKHEHSATGQRPSVTVLAERGVPGAVIDAIVRCWAADPASRPPMVEVAAVLAAALEVNVVSGYQQPRVAAAVTAPPAPSVSVPAVVAPLLTAGPPRGGIAAELTAALAARDTARVVAGLKVLAGLESDAQRVQCLQEGAGVAVKDALAGFAGDLEVARAACCALQSLVIAADSRVPLVRDGAHVVVMAVARAHAAITAVWRAACGALLNLSLAADCRGELRRDGAK